MYQQHAMSSVGVFQAAGDGEAMWLLILLLFVLETLQLRMNTRFKTKSSVTRTCTQSRAGGLVRVMLTQGDRHVLTMLNTRKKGWYEVFGILLGTYELRSERS